MIQLFMKENATNRQRLTVRDERGQIIYFIEGRWGRKNDLISLYKINGQHLISLKQQKLSPLATFDLMENGEKVGFMRKHPGLFGLRDSYFTIHPQQWVVTGDFEDLYFTVHRDNHFIMECEKGFKDGNAVYVLKIKHEEDAPLSALISTVFDHYSRKKDEEIAQEKAATEDYNLGLLNNFQSEPLQVSYLVHPSSKYKTKTR